MYIPTKRYTQDTNDDCNNNNNNKDEVIDFFLYFVVKDSLKHISIYNEIFSFLKYNIIHCGKIT